MSQTPRGTAEKPIHRLTLYSIESGVTVNAGARAHADEALATATETLRKYGQTKAAELAPARFHAADSAAAVVFVGEVKRGKSTLVNSLIGRPDLAPVGVGECRLGDLPVQIGQFTESDADALAALAGLSDTALELWLEAKTPSIGTDAERDRLLDLLGEYGLRHARKLAPRGAHAVNSWLAQRSGVDELWANIELDLTRAVLTTRTVRACTEIEHLALTHLQAGRSGRICVRSARPRRLTPWPSSRRCTPSPIGP